MDLDDLALRYPCTACGAEPGYWCVTYRPTVHAPGRLATWLHAQRRGPLEQASWAGHNDGERMAYDSAAQALEGARLGHVWALRNGTPVIRYGEPVEEWLRGRARRVPR